MPRTLDTTQYTNMLDKRIAFISRKTGEDEEHIRGLLVQYSMAILAYGEEDTEHVTLLLMMVFLAGLYIGTLQKGEEEIHVSQLLNGKTHRHAHKTE